MSQFEESILVSLRRISRAIGMHSRQLKKDFHLTAPQLVCLRQLSQGPSSAGQLARAVSLSPGTVTGILDRLEARGLVERRRSLRDKRRVEVALTTAAQSLIRQAPTPLHQSFSRRLRSLPDEDQRSIDETLQQIVAMMEAQELDAAPLLSEETVLSEADDGMP